MLTLICCKVLHFDRRLLRNLRSLLQQRHLRRRRELGEPKIRRRTGSHSARDEPLRAGVRIRTINLGAWIRAHRTPVAALLRNLRVLDLHYRMCSGEGHPNVDNL